MQKVSQVTDLQDRSLGPYTLKVQCVPRRRVGHFDVDIFLKDNKGEFNCEPVVTGIYSKGNPSNKIFGWLDMHYLDCLIFEDEKAIVLSEQEGLAEGLFEMLGHCIPPGGMIMCSYVTDMTRGIASPLHEVTRRCMALNSLGIPPAATPIGRLLIAAGCCNIKGEAYDVQGSSRLAGEKALDKEYEKRFAEGLIEQLEGYVEREPSPEYKDLEDTCRSNAGEILGKMIMR